MKTKISNPNTTQKKQTKRVSSKENDYEDYYDYSIFKRQPINIDGIKRKAEMLIQWSMKDEDALTLDQWYSENGLSGTTIDRWKKRCPEFEEAVELAKRIIGTRREIGGLKRKLDPSFVQNSMPIFKKEYADHLKWREEIKKPLEEKNETKFIFIPPYTLDKTEE